ncbi:iron uptake porin [Mastigocoleus sp. MO_188.B34]|uniref:iron uptake porin n=1 Tax=Mastigocoleus sp. MO_188.B34 TaxID=3036635 RepID=UPI00261DC60F|nr:iron uptake porin [Mastigocoleus sp. MO_188.B34]MDJ0694006.1 iron uptake porin [Mastigocoleus sp. MO_188.B34]
MNKRKIFFKLLLASPLAFGALSVGGKAALAETDAMASPTPQKKMAQVTSVSQLSDVQTTSWAFQALQSLVERYGCIAGYPNGTYRGNRALTRYEFAAGLNACLDRVNELIATATSDLVTRDDLATLQKLQEEFSAELATLRGRTDALEARTAELEANQFSTTTKLEGEVVAGLTSVLASDQVNGEDVEDTNAALGARVRLDLVTSFTGKDSLVTRLEANNAVNPEIGTLEGGLSFATEDDPSADVEIGTLFYEFPLGKSTDVYAFATGAEPDEFVDTINILDGDGGSGSISAFGTRNPIYYQVEEGAGLAVKHEFGENLEVSLGYIGTTASDPGEDGGLFNGDYGAIAQLTFKPSDRFKVGLTYVNAYNQFLTTGSNAANFRRELGGGAFQTIDTPVSSNSYGLQTSFEVSKNVVLGGWVGYTNARNLSTSVAFPDRGSLDIWNWAVTAGFPDLGKKGNLGGIVVGMEPKVTDSSIEGLDENNDTSLHLEAFYQYRLNDNISITPGVIWLTAPDHDSDNDDIVIGTLRTTLSF